MTPPGERDWLLPEELITELKQRFGDAGAGFPLPMPGYSMTIHPKFRFAKNFEQPFPGDRPETEEQANPNSEHGPNDKPNPMGARHLAMALSVLNVSRIWSIRAELRAFKKLRRHVSSVQFGDYLLTGSFLELSERSQVIYFFRRLRPTVAIRNGRILAALCSHPIGFYDGTWAGAMVPTDDVISHLLLMRADEHRFWRISNQHAPWEVQAGL